MYCTSGSASPYGEATVLQTTTPPPKRVQRMYDITATKLFVCSSSSSGAQVQS
jgi:hypothetical protein